MPDGAQLPVRQRRVYWTRRTSLTARILAVNIIALGLMAGSLFYLDSYRKQLVGERFRLATAEAEIAAAGLAAAMPRDRPGILAKIGTDQRLRLRLYEPDGQLQLDSFRLAGPSFVLNDPADDPWYQNAARQLDRSMNWVLGSPPIPDYREPALDAATNWPELADASRTHGTIVMERAAPDESPVISAASPVGSTGELLLTTRNAPDITQAVRDARQTLAIVLAVTLLISIQLSLFLARTIVQPLRALVRAAIRVRLGRERQVEVPRLPERRDEIGLLARALSDMTGALRNRIDAVEAFAADVAHEIKNPLASLRSALESLDKVKDDELRGELTGIAAHDVQRIDRLVTDIAEASRIDAELSRTEFDEIDLMTLAETLVRARAERGDAEPCEVRVEPQDAGPWIVPGDAARLERVLVNLLDNACSFSPRGGSVVMAVTRHPEHIELTVTDDGPGIPPEAREKIFDRFHSLRPESEQFGSHSGLGLAIARTIAEAHDGSLTATDRPDGKPGACLVLELPTVEEDANVTACLHHASCVAIGGRALLIEGPPGSGKSSLALALIDRGAVLIGDDGVSVEVIDGRLHASPPPNIAGLLEVRNLGPIEFTTAGRVRVALILRFDAAAERFVDQAEPAELCGVEVPLIRLWPESPLLAVKAELALRTYGLP